MIESFVEGRVRLRSPLLADAAFAERVRSEFLRVDGVRTVEVNTHTNGLLLEYDKTRLPLSFLMRAAPILAGMDDLTRLSSGERVAAFEKLMEKLNSLVSR
jgi:hypothetical protein